jgi:hypothetical protein
MNGNHYQAASQLGIYSTHVIIQDLVMLLMKMYINIHSLN